MIDHLAEYYLEANFVIGHRDCGARFYSVLGETQ